MFRDGSRKFLGGGGPARATLGQGRKRRGVWGAEPPNYRGRWGRIEACRHIHTSHSLQSTQRTVVFFKNFTSHSVLHRFIYGLILSPLSPPPWIRPWRCYPYHGYADFSPGEKLSIFHVGAFHVGAFRIWDLSVGTTPLSLLL